MVKPNTLQENFMSSYGFTNAYLTRNETPWFPVMGEIHYSRLREEEWEKSLFKMKAGGVTLASAYVIWIHHEEEEGKLDFSGNRNLRKFIETADRCGIKIALRIGPWSHGEVRNGGFPDWLLEKARRGNFKLRSNDREYLEEVEKFYGAVHSQAEGLFFNPETGEGPIIAVQIENEYGHCGGLTGEEGEKHMRTLAEMARSADFDAPLYTATGWGGAVTGGLIPVMGGYCESPWDQRLTEIEPSGNYIFTYERNDHNIGSDFGFGTGITFDISRFPYLTAELGGGLQITRHRRPVAYASDIGAMSLVKLGSGVNLLGYYMYHGGTNPTGKLSTLQETRETGSPNDLPEFSYDFRAPLREYGQVSPTFRELKLLTLFLRDFGSSLCMLPAEIPEKNPLKPDNRGDLRHSFRCSEGRGYAFISNYQRRKVLDSHRDVRLTVPGTNEKLPAFDIENGEYFFMPFNMELEGKSTGDSQILKSAQASPLCILHRGKGGEEPVYVFYSRNGKPATGEGVFNFEGKITTPVLALTRDEALDAWPVQTGDGEHLLVTEGTIVESGENASYIFTTRRPCGSSVENHAGRLDGFAAYPPLASILEGFTGAGNVIPEPAAAGIPSIGGKRYVRSAEKEIQDILRITENFSASASFSPEIEAEPRRDHSGDAYSSGKPFVYKITLSGLPSSLKEKATLAGKPVLSDVFLRIEYEGESARLYLNGKPVADNLYPGKLKNERNEEADTVSPVWEVSLKSIWDGKENPGELKLEIFPLAEGAPVFIERKPVFQNGTVGKLLGVSLEAEFETKLCLN